MYCEQIVSKILAYLCAKLKYGEFNVAQYLSNEAATMRKEDDVIAIWDTVRIGIMYAYQTLTRTGDINTSDSTFTDISMMYAIDTKMSKNARSIMNRFSRRCRRLE